MVRPPMILVAPDGRQAVVYLDDEGMFRTEFIETLWEIEQRQARQSSSASAGLVSLPVSDSGSAMA